MITLLYLVDGFDECVARCNNTSVISVVVVGNDKYRALGTMLVDWDVVYPCQKVSVILWFNLPVRQITSKHKFSNNLARS